MASTEAPVNLAILDDYQNVALKVADWSRLQGRAHITVFNDHISDPAELVERLQPFEVISVMRERTPLPRSIIEQLPNLKLIASNARRNASIDYRCGERPWHHRVRNGLLIDRHGGIDLGTDPRTRA